MGFHHLGGFQGLGSGFDGAGPGDHVERAAPNFAAGHVEDGVLGLILAADELEFLLDRCDGFDLGQGDQRFEGVMAALVANAGDDGAFDAADQAGFVLESFHGVGHFLNLLLVAAWFQNDDHGCASTSLGLSPVFGQQKNRPGRRDGLTLVYLGVNP